REWHERKRTTPAPAPPRSESRASSDRTIARSLTRQTCAHVPFVINPCSARLLKPMRLSGGRQHGAPRRPIRVEAFFLFNQQLDRNVNELVVKIANHQPGFASHRGVDRIPRIQVAQD